MSTGEFKSIEKVEESISPEEQELVNLFPTKEDRDKHIKNLDLQGVSRIEFCEGVQWALNRTLYNFKKVEGQRARIKP